MSDFATLADVILLTGRAFTTEEQERVTALLPLVSDALRYEASKVGKNLDDMIYDFNGEQVIFDEDLAKIFECKNGTKEINQALKNNLEKFPNGYFFRISEDDFRNLKSKLLTSKKQ